MAATGSAYFITRACGGGDFRWFSLCRQGNYWIWGRVSSLSLCHKFKFLCGLLTFGFEVDVASTDETSIYAGTGFAHEVGVLPYSFTY